MREPIQPNFYISHLIDAPGAARVLARWFVEEWGPYYGFEGPGDAEADLAACTARDRLPICIVARDDVGTVLGTAALRNESAGSELGVGPWLAGLLVGAEHRGKGVGRALIGAVWDNARRLGFKEIFTSTNTGATLLESTGWKLFGDTLTLRGKASAYRRSTDGE